MRLIFYLLLLTVNLNDLNELSAQNTGGVITIADTKNLFSEEFNLLDKHGSDTTEVIYVVIEEDFYESVMGNQVDTIYYPALKSFYGYHVQNWKPYNVVFYDLNWNIIHDPIHIKKRKLFKNK